MGIKATYLKQNLTEYQGNPFIEALPPILSIEEAYELLSYYPPYDNEERNLPVHQRLHAILRLKRVFEPLERTLELEKTFSKIIRHSYINRNPLEKEHIEILSELYSKLSTGSQDLTLNRDLRPASLSFSIIGYPGVGKSSSIEMILALYPQVIVHREGLNVIQIVWIKLNCPHDGSLKTLCMSFFQKIDELIGSDYLYKFGHKRNSISSMIIHMGHLAKLHGISVIVIDEIQHLLTSKGDVPEQMMNFFVTIVNEIGISVVIVGTMKAKGLLQKDFRQARRSADVGNIVWQQMNRDENWDVFMMSLWEYQWTKNVTPLTEDFSKILYEESQGIKDIAIKIYMIAQTNAIVTGLETITEPLIRSIINNELSIVKPMIDALKKGDINRLLLYDDLNPFDVENYINEQIEYENIKEKMRSKAIDEQKKVQNENRSISAKVIMSLVNLGIEPEIAEQTTESIIKKKKNYKETELMQVVLSQVEKKKEETREPTNKDKKGLECRLKSVIENGRNQKQTAYESLLEKGYIASPSEDFL
ncbi:transposase [Halalkalibacillus sediminis]|uniref:Transposase n=2 Tax=Halalkalibacillus sediminis TaxID=2018042 RepID=A0A2I0QUY5_9BACI|nr:transposase [Halalkalibacillus sediminis]